MFGNIQRNNLLRDMEMFDRISRIAFQVTIAAGGNFNKLFYLKPLNGARQQHEIRYGIILTRR